MDTTTTRPEKNCTRGQPSPLTTMSVCTEHRNKKMIVATTYTKRRPVRSALTHVPLAPISSAKCRITQKAYGGLQAYLASPCLLCSREAALGRPCRTAESDQLVGSIRQQGTGCVPWVEEASLSALRSECKCK